jgi:nicotinamidase-related amidase
MSARQEPQSTQNVPVINVPPIITQYVPALIVIDMQQDFVYGSLQVPDAASIIEPINSLIDLPFSMYVATRDYHPDNHVSFAQTHEKPAFGKHTIFHSGDTSGSAVSSAPMGEAQSLTPIPEQEQMIHCVAYIGGADFVAGLKATKFDYVLHKGTHPHIESYSAFRDVWSKGPSDLPALLLARGVTDVYFVGMAGDYSLKYSALDAIDYGYNTWVVRDAVRSMSNEMMAEEELHQRGVQFTTIGEVTKKLEAEKERGSGPEPIPEC